MNNYYNGKYSNYSGHSYIVIASSAEEARQLVLDNQEWVLKDLMTKKYNSKRKVLSKNLAVPITEDRVHTVKQTLASIHAVKLTPNGPQCVETNEEGEVYKIH